MKTLASLLTVTALLGGVLSAPAPHKAAPVSNYNYGAGNAIYTGLDVNATDGTYQATVLKHHNVHRANHSAPAAQWGGHIAAWAMELASRCTFAHNTSIGTKSYGQNIAAGTEAKDVSYVISDEFYNGEVNWFKGLYGQENPSFANFSHWGHFSQVVWSNSSYVGCATYNCTKTGIKGLEGLNIAPFMTVCNYYPPGNMGGEYGDNIGKSLNKPTITGSY